MRKNLASWDRVLRGLGATAALACAALGPFSATLRGLLGATGVYLWVTALGGTCLGYRLMGKSTCKVEPQT